MPFAEKLNKIMEKKKITAYKLYKLTGISQSTIGQWRIGKFQPNIEKLDIVASALDVTIADLIDETEQKEKKTTFYLIINYKASDGEIKVISLQDVGVGISMMNFAHDLRKKLNVINGKQADVYL